MRVPTFKRFPALAKSYCRFTRHDLHVSRVLLTITLKRCRHGGPYLHPCYHRCLLLCLESRPHDLYALGGSTEPVVAPQWIFGQAREAKKSLFPPVGPNTVPAPVPYSRERLVFRSGYNCHLQMVLWTCGPPGARTTGRVETCQ